MTSDALAQLRWFNANTDRIRKDAEHDAAKLEALIDDPALAREAMELFPDRPLLYPMLREYLYADRLLARYGIFPIDGPATDEQTAEMQRRNREMIAKWRIEQRSLKRRRKVKHKNDGGRDDK